MAVWRGPRRTCAAAAAAALVGGAALVGSTVASSSAAAAASAGTGSIVYQVRPIAIQASASTSAAGLTPGACIASVGLACYDPQILHQAYQVPWTIDGAAAGTGEQVAIVDAYGSPTVALDLATFDAAFGLPPADLHVYHPDGQPTYNPRQVAGETGWAEETSLDVQTVHDLAPGARINLVVASSPDGNAINVAEDYAVTHHLGTVLSMSFGAPEAAIAGGGNNLQLQQADAIFHQAVTQGMSLFASSGDRGATNGLAAANALFPASDPEVTAAGGTDLFVRADTSHNTTSTNGSYAGETAWNDSDPATCPFGCTLGVFGATGGAPSAVFPAPAYQTAVSGQAMRTTSDVAFNASVYTSTLVYLGFLGGSSNGFYFFGGTSESAPSWAAITADLAQGARHGFGLLNTTLYALAANSTSYHADFHDVTVGNNRDPYPSAPGFPARSGYDLPTGLGTPIVSGLLASLAPHATAGYRQP